MREKLVWVSRADRRMLRPIGLWIRKTIFRLHLWLGAGATAYILFISVSGCAIVFEHELYRFFSPDPQVTLRDGSQLSIDELMRAAKLTYPRDQVVGVWERRLSTMSVAEIWLEEEGVIRRRLFHPYTGADLGNARPFSLHALAILRKAHTELMAGSTGRLIHGIGAIVLTMLSLSGAVVWWSGIKSRRRHFFARADVESQRRVSQLHRATGPWICMFGIMWGVTGACFIFPSLLQAAQGSSAIGEATLQSLYMLHSGSAGGWLTRTIWAMSGLGTSFLAITGMMMWWKGIAKSGRSGAYR